MRALFLVAFAGFSAGQAQEFHVRSWHVEEGLPDATITAVAQTPDGYLWVGTPRGLVRFDGATFRTFGVGPATGLTETHIAALLVDRSGWLWVAGAGGSLACSEAGRFRTVSSAEGGAVRPLPVLPKTTPGAQTRPRAGCGGGILNSRRILKGESGWCTRAGGWFTGARGARTSSPRLMDCRLVRLAPYAAMGRVISGWSQELTFFVTAMPGGWSLPGRVPWVAHYRGSRRRVLAAFGRRCHGAIGSLAAVWFGGLPMASGSANWSRHPGRRIHCGRK